MMIDGRWEREDGRDRAPFSVSLSGSSQWLLRTVHGSMGQVVLDFLLMGLLKKMMVIRIMMLVVVGR